MAVVQGAKLTEVIVEWWRVGQQPESALYGLIAGGGGCKNVAVVIIAKLDRLTRSVGDAAADRLIFGTE
jgi:hypothetical protein